MPDSEILSSRPEPLWYLQRSPLFDGLSAQEMDDLIAAGRLVGVSKGDEIYAEGDPGQTVYFVKLGGVKIITTNADGKDITLAYLGELELFGETALADRSPRQQRAVATEESCLIAFEVEFIEQLMARQPALGLSITKFVGLRLKKIQTRLQSLMFRSPLQRVAGLLLELADDFGEKDAASGDIELKIRITHSEIASLIGVTRESVTYALGQLELDELVRVVKRRIYLLKPDSLTELAR